MVWRADVELHAELWDGVSFPRSRLFLGGIALLGRTVHCFVVMKLLTPLRALVGAGLKPVAPLLGENVGFSGVLGSQWCRRFHVDNVSVS